MRVQIEIFRTLFTIFRRRGATLRVLDQSIDTSTAAGKCFFDMLAAFSSLKLVSVKSVNLMESPKQKLKVFIKAVKR